MLDASAVLALLWAEPGHERVADALDDAVISTVNIAEVASKLSDRGLDPAKAGDALDLLHLTVAPFSAKEARLAGAMRADTRSQGLSLGDRACLACALDRGARALTADAAWAAVDVNVDVEVIR
ncbi:MAG: type II toxin-antitoxin system VapC family toxin [Pseudomonadota bacterium]